MTQPPSDLLWGLPNLLSILYRG